MARNERPDRALEIVLRDGEPAAVILDIERYREMLERLEELDDLETLHRARRQATTFRSLDEFLEDFSSPQP